MSSDESTNQPNEYTLPTKKEKVVSPLPGKAASDGQDQAVNLIRQKINTLYSEEPSAKEELAESKATGHRSKHQQFMYNLSSSGKSLADIQTAWHDYYVQLPDKEKHQVWQEFYANHDKTNRIFKAQTRPATSPSTHAASQRSPLKRRRGRPYGRSAGDIKRQLMTKLSSASTERPPSKLKSLLFGLAIGTVTLVLMLFGFFNERFIAPFITPSRNVSSTPLIVDASAAVGPEAKIIIPKINIEIPVVYDEPSIDEKAVQRALEEGVIHYPITEEPGENGNAVFFGHSSNNILNPGKYKFAFVLLNQLENGDTFMLHKAGQRYVYRVFKKEVVKPTNVSVLNDIEDKQATATLITCDPPGTSINRLVVYGEQISPSPSTNVASDKSDNNTATATQPDVLPSNAPSLWQRFTGWLTG